MSEASAKSEVALRASIMWHHLSVRVLMLTWVFALVYLIARWQPEFVIFMALGFLGQFTTEYMIHRFIFHLPAPKNQFWFNVLYLCHYGHHDFPTNRHLLFVPIWFAVPMMLAGVVAYALVFSIAGFTHAFDYAIATVFVGHITTFLAYEWYHMTAHMNVRKTWVERHVSERHALHHFRDYTKMYHVSFGGEVIDRVMGTHLDVHSRAEIEKREFIRTIGLDPADPRLISARETFCPDLGIDAQQMIAARRGSTLAAAE